MAANYTIPTWRQDAAETYFSVDASSAMPAHLNDDKSDYIWEFSSDQRYDTGCHNDRYVEDGSVQNQQGSWQTVPGVGNGGFPKDLPRSGRFGR